MQQLVIKHARASETDCVSRRSVDTHRKKNGCTKTGPPGLEDAGSGACWSCGSGRATVSFTDYRATGIKNLSARVQQLVPKHAHASETK